MALGSKSVLSGGVEQEIKQGFFLEFLLSPYLFDSQPEKVVVRVSLGLVWFGTFKEKIGGGRGKTPNHQPGKQSKPSALGFSSGKKNGLQETTLLSSEKHAAAPSFPSAAAFLMANCCHT